MKNSIQKEIKNMITNANGICISILMPVAPPGKGDEENKIRFKNLLQKAEEELIGFGMKKNETEERLKDIRELSSHPSFFRNINGGIAVYISKDFTKVIPLPNNMPEKVTIGDNFFIKPLLPSLHGNGEYFVLGISKSNARLFSASKNSIFEIDISNITKEAQKQIDMIDSEKHFALHSATGGGSGTIFHGQDNSALEKDLIKQYFRLIDEGLKDILNKHEYPLVLAGVEYLLPIYQEVNKYKNILAEGINGNPDDLEPQILQNKSWKIMEPVFKEEMLNDIEKFNSLNGTGNASGNIEEILGKAEYGQVESLFINTKDIFSGDCSDLLNKAALNTIKNNGKVYGIDTNELLSNLSVAAVYRY